MGLLSYGERTSLARSRSLLGAAFDRESPKSFIESHKLMRTDGLRWGVEPIGSVLQIAPATFYAARTWRPAARDRHDDELKP